LIKTKAKAAGTLFKENTVRVLGHDGAYSIPLKDGKVFWCFGDTLLGPERKEYDPKKVDLTEWCFNDPWAKKNIRMISNSGLISQAQKIQELITGGFQYYTQECNLEDEKVVEAREIIPVPKKLQGTMKERMAFWPFDGIEVDGTLYVFYFMVKCIMTKMYVYGAGLAKSTYPYENFQRLCSTDPVLNGKTDKSERSYVWWDNSRSLRNLRQVPGFGTAVLKRTNDNYLYLYGSKLEKTGKCVVHAVSLARVRKNAIEYLEEYQYLIESPSERNSYKCEWGDRPRESAIIFDGNANELSVSYNPYLEKYVTVYSSTRSLFKERECDEIHMRVADRPEGPWSLPMVIYRPERSWKKDFCYAAKEHPEYSSDGKTVFVTYVSHQRYFPELVEVQVELSR
jgi:hypothetical protein